MYSHHVIVVGRVRGVGRVRPRREEILSVAVPVHEDIEVLSAGLQTAKVFDHAVDLGFGECGFSVVYVRAGKWTGTVTWNDLIRRV